MNLRNYLLTCGISALIAFTASIYILFAVIDNGGLGDLNLDAALSGLSSASFEQLIVVFVLSLLVSIGGFIGAHYAIFYKSPKPLGDAKFATKEVLNNQGWLTKLVRDYPIDGRIIGTINNFFGKIIHYVAIPPDLDDNFPNLFVAAPPGSGKTTGIIIPNLVTFTGSVICLDVKGELYEQTANYRLSELSHVYRFDPLNPDNSHSFNPMGGLDLLHPDLAFEELGRIAESLLPSLSAISNWRAGCVYLFQSAGMLALQRGSPNIGTVFDIVSKGDFESDQNEVQHTQAGQGFGTLANMDSRTRTATVTILLDNGLSAWRNPSIRRATERSDFSLDYLREKKSAIYLVTKETDIEIIKPLLRVIFQLAITRISNQQWDSVLHKYKVLLLLDEFEKLGPMSTILEALKTLRGAGGRIITVTQNLSQLKSTYTPDQAKAIMALSNVQIFSATSDNELIRHITDLGGKYTHRAADKSVKSGMSQSFLQTPSITYRDNAIDLIRHDMISQMDDDKFLVLRIGLEPLFVTKIRSYDNPYFLEKLALIPQIEGSIMDFMRDIPNIPEKAIKNAESKARQIYHGLSKAQKESILTDSLIPDDSSEPYLPPGMRENNDPNRKRRNFKKLGG